MAESSGWESASREANRRRQHREFQALPLREKLAIIEQLGEVAEHFAARRRARGLPVASPLDRGRARPA
jgi:hypothetical protein